MTFARLIFAAALQSQGLPSAVISSDADGAVPFNSIHTAVSFAEPPKEEE
jgi:hypothetical protein